MPILLTSTPYFCVYAQTTLMNTPNIPLQFSHANTSSAHTPTAFTFCFSLPLSALFNFFLHQQSV